MHGEEDFGGADAGGEVGLGFQETPTGRHGDDFMILNPQGEGVVGVDIEEERVGVEFAEDCAFVGSGLGVPLGACAPSGEKGEGVGITGWFWEGSGGIEDELGAAGWGEEFAVSEKAPFPGLRRALIGERPLNSAGFIEVGIAFDAGDVAGLSFGEFLHELEGS